MDLLQREGHYPVPPQAPKTLGVEFSGTIEELGPDSKDNFKKGDEVFGLAYGGAYAEYIAVNTKMLLHKPAHLSWEEAAGVPEVSTFSLHFQCKRYRKLVLTMRQIDMDYSYSSHVPCWRIHPRQNGTLACRRIICLYCWHPAFETRRSGSYLCK